ncbi:MAG: STAS domain-containing protein [Bacteroidales bacterium]|nr:STAS domain-containing protein [Bacteroidales bacterium]
MKSKKIKLNKKFDDIISTRAAIDEVFDFDLRNLEKICIDFSKISFISSSAAHQLVLKIREFEKNIIQVDLLNINDDVQRMINISKTGRKNIFTTQPVEVVKDLSEKELNELLL